MILYNVTINVEDEVHHQWLEWMQKEHIPEMLSTGLFTGYRMSRLLDVEDSGTTYSIQYSCHSLAEYHTYKEKYAPRMQQEGIKRFADKFTAFRTLMEVVE
jgi:hypothetical protein